MTFVDIHAHLDFECISNDKATLNEEMKKNNIFALSNTLNLENYIHTKELYKGLSQVQVIPGLYPTNAGKISKEEFEEFLTYLKKHKQEYIAIGEVGLDAHETKDEEVLLVQEERFRKIIELAIELNKALLIHTRKRELKALEIIEEYVVKTGFRKFNLHCFTGKKKYFQKIKELRIYCSIPLTILNTQSFQILVEELPISQLLVETDSPYLHPEKITNTPLTIPQIYAKIAQIKGYDAKEIENILYKNYMKFIY
ncbi:MAG: TatD family hydrolase [Nanoarchaeota archaeon]|nr:TatD family hydrolase [Nanoarchaeota archaeon]